MLDISDKTLDNFIEAIEHPVEMTVFKTTIYDNNVKDAIWRHTMSIAMAAVHNMFSKFQSTNLDDYRYCFSGFLEQEGRFPNENDKIRIIRGRYYFEQITDFILSEVWFEVVRNNNKSIDK